MLTKLIKSANKSVVTQSLCLIEEDCMWFEELTGFREETPVQVRKNVSYASSLYPS